MKVIYQLSEFKKYRESLDSFSQKIGFVPTMGALHKGHLSLLEKAKKSSDISIVSIFVNPSQFNDPKDLKNYPRNVETDLKLLSPYNPDIVFIPEVDDIYPEPDNRKFEFGILDKVMEGKHRPGHFNGVAQVVSRLFDIVQPHLAFFGQKDFQQLAIIKSLVKQLDYKIEIVSCPIIREKNGLAMSSRNQLLTKKEREESAFLYEVLQEAKSLFPSTSLDVIVGLVSEKINTKPIFQLDYFELVDSDNLKPVKEWDYKSELIACIAVKINKIRLIDNLIFT